MDFRGRTPKKLAMEWGGGVIPALSARNVKPGLIDLEEGTYYGSEALYQRWMTRGHTRAGDVVMTTEAPLGNVAILRDDRRYILSQRTVLLRFDESIALAEYMYFALQGERFQSLLAENASGSTATGIQRRRLEQLRVLVPHDVAEQRLIADTLSDAGAWTTAVAKTIKKKQALRDAVVWQLLSGERRLPGFDASWSKHRLGDVASVLKGSGLSKSLISPRGRRPCILYGELFTKYGRTITHVGSRTDSSEGLISRAGDVLVPGSTTTTGIDLATASALLQGGVPLGGDINVVRPLADAYDPVFMAYYLTHARRDEIARMAQGITIIHLYPFGLASLQLDLPSQEEQRAIVRVLSDLTEAVEVEKARLLKIRDLGVAMRQELLTGDTRLAAA